MYRRPYIRTGKPKVRRTTSKILQTARKTGKSLYGSPDEWNNLKKDCKRLAGYRCKKCGNTFKGKWAGLLHAHHKIPLSRGGKNTQANLEALCRKCHEKEHPHMEARKKRKR